MLGSVSKPVLVVALALSLAPAGLWAQKKEKGARPITPPASVRPRAKMADGPKGPGGGARPPLNPYNVVDRWNAMNPRQRERLLAKMPPERQKQLLDKVEKFNALPKQEQQMARERYDRLRKLPQEEQQVVLRDIRRFNNLPPGRQQAMNQEFLKLRQMSESERAEYLASSEFKDKFYPNEQQMIGNLSKVIATRQ